MTDRGGTRGGLHRGAFSLLEVLVACVLLAVLAVPLFQSLHTGQQGSERIIEESTAANLGSSLLERLVHHPYSQLPVIPADTPEGQLADYFSPPSTAPILDQPDRAYTRLVTVELISRRTEDPADSSNGAWGAVKLVRVKVVWRPEYLDGRAERNLVVETLVTDDAEVW